MSEERDQLPVDDGGEDEDIDLGAEEGDELDELEPEAEPEPEPEVEPEPRLERQRQVRRGQVHRLREQNAELVRRIAALEQRPQAPPQPAFDPQAAAREEQEFRASLEQMLPHEAALAVANRSERRMQQQLTQVALLGFDRSDSAEFARVRAAKPIAERLAPQVEAMLAENRRQGDLRLGRMDIYHLLLGREVDTRAAARPSKPAGRAPRGQTRPASGRGDVAASPGGGRRSQADADAALLRGITTADI